MNERNHFEWDIGTATYSGVDSDGFPEVQVDPYGGANGTDPGSMPPLEQHSLYGFLSVPLDPDPSGLGAQVLHAWEGSRGHAWVLDDPRVIPKLPPVKKGGSIQYAATGSFDLLDGQNGSSNVYVPYDLDGSGKAQKAMLVSLDVSNPGEETIYVVHGEGMALTMTAGGKNSIVLKNKKGDAYLELNDDGLTLNGSALNANGGLSVGNPLAAATPAALATPLLTYLASMQAAISALSAVVLPAGPVQGGVTIPPVPAPPPAIAAKNLMSS